MNMLFIKHFFVGLLVSELPRVSVFGYFPLYICIYLNIYNLYYNFRLLNNLYDLYYNTGIY